MKQILFVSGVGRSGTSALVNVLNAHPRVLIGQERFFKTIRRGDLKPGHFDRARFLDVRTEDTHEDAGLKLRGADPATRYDAAQIVGEKFPSLFRHFETIFTRFPEAQHLYIFRNPLSVIESYDARHANPDDNWKLTWQDGLDAWNESIGKVAALPPEMQAKFHLVRYETLYDSVANLNRMLAGLGLPELEKTKLAPFVKRFRELNVKPVPRRDDLRTNVAENADWESYRKLCARVKQG